MTRHVWMRGRYRPTSSRRFWVGWPGRRGGTYPHVQQTAFNLGLFGRGYWFARVPRRTP
jgi:hypothetical protein